MFGESICCEKQTEGLQTEIPRGVSVKFEPFVRLPNHKVFEGVELHHAAAVCGAKIIYIAAPEYTAKAQIAAAR